jgi:hypothetical protein
MITGVVVGSALVRWAVGSPKVEVMRNAAPTAEEDYDIDRIRVAPADQRPAQDSGIHATTLAFGLVAMAILVAIALLWSARAVVNALGSDILDKFPLFPVAVIGGFIVQWLTMKADPAHRIDKRAVQGISAVALDALLVCAIGTMSLATLGSNVPAIVAFTVIGVVWSVLTAVWFGRRFHRTHWFEHSIADFGQSQGQCRDRVRAGRHGRPPTANQHGQRLRLQTIAVRAVPRRWSAHRTIGAADSTIRATGVHHHQPCADGGFRRVGYAPQGQANTLTETICVGTPSGSTSRRPTKSDSWPAPAVRARSPARR